MSRVMVIVGIIACKRRAVVTVVIAIVCRPRCGVQPIHGRQNVCEIQPDHSQDRACMPKQPNCWVLDEPRVLRSSHVLFWWTRRLRTRLCGFDKLITCRNIHRQPMRNFAAGSMHVPRTVSSLSPSTLPWCTTARSVATHAETARSQRVMESASRAVDDELKVLAAIYGDDYVQLTDRSFTITLLHSSQPFSLSFNLPSAYPVTSPPSVDVHTSSLLRSEHQAAVQSTVQQAWQDAAGEVCCYQAVEAVRAVIDVHREQVDAASAAAHTAAATEADADTDDDREAEEHDHAISHYSDDEHSKQQLTPQQWQQLKQQQHTNNQPHSATTTAAAPFVSGPSYTDRKSVFIAHYTAIHSTIDLTRLAAYLHSHPKLSRATHNITAYRLNGTGSGSGSSSVYSEEGCDDDGEGKAGGRLLHLLRAMGCENAWVCVSRWYGGVKLGSDRFRIINNVARQLLEENGYGERKGVVGSVGSSGVATSSHAGGGGVKKGNKR